MSRKTSPLLPGTERLLAALGERLRLARLRRRLPAKQVAERAGMAEKTLRAVERGAPGVTLGAYAAVLQVLQLDNTLALVAENDPLGRQLQDKALDGFASPRRTRRTATPAPEQPAATITERAASTPATGITSDALLALLETGSSPTNPELPPKSDYGKHRQRRKA